MMQNTTVDCGRLQRQRSADWSQAFKSADEMASEGFDRIGSREHGTQKRRPHMTHMQQQWAQATNSCEDQQTTVPCMVPHTLSLSAWEAEAVESLLARDQPGLYIKFQPSHGYTGGYWFKRRKKDSFTAAISLISWYFVDEERSMLMSATYF